MCCRFCELPLIPLLTAPAAVISVVSMSAKAWLDGFLEDGTLFLRLSPWYLCVADCKDCGPRDHEHDRKACFWMRDWGAAGFDNSKHEHSECWGLDEIHVPLVPSMDHCLQSHIPGSLTAIQHMEYWCLGALILSLFPSLVACLDRRSRLCPLDCRRPAIILLAVACLLSVTSLSVFGSSREQGLSELAGGRALDGVLRWPYHLRLVGSILTCVATMLGLLHECRLRHGDYVDPTDEEKVTIVAIQDDDMMEDLSDYGDPL